MFASLIPSAARTAALSVLLTSCPLLGGKTDFELTAESEYFWANDQTPTGEGSAVLTAWAAIQGPEGSSFSSSARVEIWEGGSPIATSMSVLEGGSRIEATANPIYSTTWRAVFQSSNGCWDWGPGSNRNGLESCIPITDAEKLAD